jgi:hypothetical protein
MRVAIVDPPELPAQDIVVGWNMSASSPPLLMQPLQIILRARNTLGYTGLRVTRGSSFQGRTMMTRCSQASAARNSLSVSVGA